MGLSIYLMSAGEVLARHEGVRHFRYFRIRLLDGNYQGGATRRQVPEIDASTGLLAMAAVVAMLLLAWEIRRRRLAAARS